jgi:tRNA U34 5-methylaminomethyl-2-thiouridine-forming methyltransferase MnmC
MDFELVLTHDGSYTVYSKRYDALYHSIFGAISESDWVFLQGSNLEDYLNTRRTLSILEIGLGTGYNLLLTLLKARSYSTFVHYVAYEPFPLPAELLATLYDRLFLVQQLPTEPLIAHKEKWTWHQVTVTVYYEMWSPEKTCHQYWDIVYFDAFSPRHDPLMWRPVLFWDLFQHLKPGGKLVTYSVTGKLLRTLNQWKIPYVKRKGFAKKREMLVVFRPVPLKGKEGSS